MENSLHDIIRESVESAITKQRSDGAMPPGHNGHYGDPETPSRNTAHWLRTFLSVYERTGEEQFQTAAMDAYDYLCEDRRRPFDETFHARTNPKKFHSNGLIGQAWVIEGLLAGGAHFGGSGEEIAVDVYTSHPYETRLNVWKTLEIDGDKNEFDIIFNHQLWFAAIGGLFDNVDSTVKRQVDGFVDRLDRHLTVKEDGLVRHPLLTDLSIANYLRLARDEEGREYLHDHVYRTLQAKRSFDWERFELEYIGFNLYGFALLHESYPNLDFWSSDRFQQVLKFARSNEFFQRITEIKYGFSYNPTGIEMAYALEVFCENVRDEQRKWLTEQFRRHLNQETCLMTSKTEDPMTLSARIYEATRLSDIDIKL